MQKENHMIAKASSASPHSWRDEMKQWTFNELAGVYLKSKSSRGKERNEVARRVIGEMKARWGDRPIDEVKKADIYMMQQELVEERGLAQATVNCYLTYLRAMLNFGVEELDLQFVPPKIKLLEENKRTNYLEPDQIQRLLQNLDPLRADMAKFAVHTGMRNNNVRLLRWRYVSDDFKEIVIPAAEMKNNKPLCIPLGKTLQALLRRRHNDKLDLQFNRPRVGEIAYVFYQQCGNPLSVKAVCNKTWRKAVQNAGLPAGTTFHTLRHSFASLHIKNGTQAIELKELGNWSSLNSIARYTHLGTEHKRVVINRLEGVLQP